LYFFIDVTSTEDEGYWIATPEASRLGDGAYKLSITGEDFSTVTDLCELTLLKRVGAVATGQHQAHIYNHPDQLVFQLFPEAALPDFLILALAAVLQIRYLLS
jgi:hypothetical protein